MFVNFGTVQLYRYFVVVFFSEHLNTLSIILLWVLFLLFHYIFISATIQDDTEYSAIVLMTLQCIRSYVPRQTSMEKRNDMLNISEIQHLNYSTIF